MLAGLQIVSGQAKGPSNGEPEGLHEQPAGWLKPEGASRFTSRRSHTHSGVHPVTARALCASTPPEQQRQQQGQGQGQHHTNRYACTCDRSSLSQHDMQWTIRGLGVYPSRAGNALLADRDEHQRSQAWRPQEAGEEAHAQLAAPGLSKSIVHCPLMLAAAMQTRCPVSVLQEGFKLCCM